MAVRIDYRTGILGKYLEIDETSWKSEVFGALNTKDRGEIKPDSLENLEENEYLEYENPVSGTFENTLQRFYGGAIETPH